MTEKKTTIALLMDHFLTVYQTTLRDAIQYEAKTRNVNILCLIGRALDSPHIHERIQNEVFNDVTSDAVEGIILSGTTLSAHVGKERVDEFCRGYALPMCNIGLQLSCIPNIVLDNRCFRLVVEHLITAHRCRKIAYIGGPLMNEEAAIRRDAFVDGLRICKTPFYPELEKVGRFTLQSGYEAVTELLNEKASFDALVAANDNMAIGAMGVLKTRGIRVPEDVKVTGFDDSLTARFHAPPLTTMRQPLEIMGRHALDLVLRQIGGETVPLTTEVDPVLYCRQSCGCDQSDVYQVIKREQNSLRLRDALTADRTELASQLENTIQIPVEQFGGWIERVLSALEQEFSGKSGRLLALFQEMLDQSGWRRWLLDELQSVVCFLKGRYPCLKDAEPALDPERLWHAIQVFLCDAAAKEQMRQQVDADLVSTLFLNRSAPDLSETLTHETLAASTIQELESIGIINAAVMVFQKGTKKKLDIIAAIKNGEGVDTEGMVCEATELLPAVLASDDSRSYVIAPLSAGGNLLGRMVLEMGAPDLYYEMLREHLSSNLKIIARHQLEIEKLKATAVAHRQELEIQHHQKLETLGLLAAGVAHDFNNMLSVMMGNLDVALLDLGENSPLHDVVLECKAVAKHSAKLCNQLLTYSGRGTMAFRRINLNQAILDLEDLLMLSVQKGAKLVLDLQEDLLDIEGDIAKLNQLLVSLVINASEAMVTAGGTIKVRTTSVPQQTEQGPPPKDNDASASKEDVLLEIIGVGMPDAHFKERFEPEGDRPGGTTAVVKIMQDHRGAILLEKHQQEGAQISMRFPALQKGDDVPDEMIVPPSSPIKGQGTLLLLDHEPGVLRMGERLLKRLGFTVLLAMNRKQAIGLCREKRDTEIRCVIIDCCESEARSIETATEIRKILPGVPLVFTSAYAHSKVLEAFSDEDRIASLNKPYDFTQLSEVLEAILC